MPALSTRTLAIGIALIVIVFATFLLVSVLNPKGPTAITATIERGVVQQIVSVSGFIEAKNTAELAFPSTGVVTEVYAREGEQVTQGDVLATLASRQLVAQKNGAEAGLAAAQARYDKLISGADDSSRSIASLNVETSEALLFNVTKEEEAKVQNAYRTLLSDSLSALSNNPNDDAVAPTITGTYTCGTEGSYTLSLYSSNAPTGYSYRYTGLESGVGAVTTDQPSALGTCGLYIQFSEESSYGNSSFVITIPNTRSSTYISNKNAYTLAQEQATKAITQAQDTLSLAKEEREGIVANPRDEEVREARAAIDQARAQIAQIDAQLSDRSIVAPFDGIVTGVDILVGESAPTTPVITVLANDAFELTTRIPEIDIMKLVLGQKAIALFDAQGDTALEGSVTYISPLATVIDGVAYFEATITLDTLPAWIRSGLNADIDIIVAEESNTLRIPKRFLIESDGMYSVRIPQGKTYATTSVTVPFIGNDGFVAITGLNEGDTIIAP